MDVALQGGQAPLAAGDAFREIDGQRTSGFGTAAGEHTPTVMPMGQAFPNSSVAEADLAGSIDKIRNDFEVFQQRLGRNRESNVIDPATGDSSQARSGSSIQDLSDSMDHAMRTQVDVLEFGIALNAGLTAVQQSQNSVKTLLEKS